jgi:NFU1 iron-sulfur cluster scaffold homolog, mitochondrial
MMETYLKETSQPVNIYLEANPNPNSLKFVANFMLLPEGESYDFPDAESTQNAPLAQVLFGFEYVRRVFYMSNFITVTKDEHTEWAEIQEELKQYIKTYLESGKPLLIKEALNQPANTPAEEDSEIVKNIKGILEEYVRPAVEQDGGAIQFHAYEDGVVKLLLQGSCSGCPASMITLKGGIENLLKRMIPEIKSVEAEGV